MSSLDELIVKAKKFLKDVWGEETLSMKIIKNEVVSGNGKLHTDCEVRLGNSTSKWHKVFYFKNGEIIDEDYHLIS